MVKNKAYFKRYQVKFRRRRGERHWFTWIMTPIRGYARVTFTLV